MIAVIATVWLAAAAVVLASIGRATSRPEPQRPADDCEGCRTAAWAAQVARDMDESLVWSEQDVAAFWTAVERAQ